MYASIVFEISTAMYQALLFEQLPVCLAESMTALQSYCHSKTFCNWTVHNFQNRNSGMMKLFITTTYVQ